MLLVIGAPVTGPLCDFCCLDKVFAVHRCEPHVSDTVEVSGRTFVIEDKDGIWNACEVCDMLIRMGQWTELLNRSCAMWEKSYNTTAPRKFIARQHEMFRTMKKEAC